VARSPGILPSDFASGLRGSLSAHPCARSELARILRATLRAFPSHPRRATGGPVRAASCRRSKGSPRFPPNTNDFSHRCDRSLLYKPAVRAMKC